MGFFRLPAELRGRCVESEPLEARRLLSTTFYVATNGNDANPGTESQPWQTIQFAFNHAIPGSTVDVLAGTYREKLTLNVSGSAAAGYTTFQAVGNVIIDGRGIAGPDLIDISNRVYDRITGFTLKDDLNVNNGAAVRLTGANDYIDIENNTITNITGRIAMAVAVYGQDPTIGASNLLISGNNISHIQASPGEALTLKGNVQNFTVTGNTLNHINGIAIDAIGGQGVSSNPATDYPRNGEISNNFVTGDRPRPGGPQVGAITIDGVQNVTVERNTCTNDQIGIFVTCVKPNVIAENDVVRDNLLYNNLAAGISVGAADPNQGRVADCQVVNNTLVHDVISDTDAGEVQLRYGWDNVIANNVIDATAGRALIDSEASTSGNTFNYNLYYERSNSAKARFRFNNRVLIGVASWQSKIAGADVNSIFAAPVFAGAVGELAPNSPGIDAGDPAYAAVGQTDVLNDPRLINGAIDIGAYEV